MIFCIDEFYDLFTSLTNFGSFVNCNNLKSVKIPEGLKSLAQQCFWRDTAWDYLDLPSTLTNLSWGNVRYLAVLVCRAATPPSFRNVYYSSATKLYVPAESVSLYRADANWSVYTNVYPIEESEYDG